MRFKEFLSLEETHVENYIEFLFLLESVINEVKPAAASFAGKSGVHHAEKKAVPIPDEALEAAASEVARLFQAHANITRTIKELVDEKMQQGAPSEEEAIDDIKPKEVLNRVLSRYSRSGKQFKPGELLARAGKTGSAAKTALSRQISNTLKRMARPKLPGEPTPWPTWEKGAIIKPLLTQLQKKYPDLQKPALSKQIKSWLGRVADWAQQEDPSHEDFPHPTFIPPGKYHEIEPDLPPGQTDPNVEQAKEILQDESQLEEFVVKPAKVAVSEAIKELERLGIHEYDREELFAIAYEAIVKMTEKPRLAKDFVQDEIKRIGRAVQAIKRHQFGKQAQQSKQTRAIVTPGGEDLPVGRRVSATEKAKAKEAAKEKLRLLVQDNPEILSRQDIRKKIAKMAAGDAEMTAAIEDLAKDMPSWRIVLADIEKMAPEVEGE